MTLVATTSSSAALKTTTQAPPLQGEGKEGQTQGQREQATGKVCLCRLLLFLFLTTTTASTGGSHFVQCKGQDLFSVYTQRLQYNCSNELFFLLML